MDTERVHKQPTSATGRAAAVGWRVESLAGARQNMATLTLDGCGIVGDCNRTGETLFKYHLSQLVRQHVSILLPQLAELDLLQNGQINPHLRYLCRIGRHFETVTQDGVRFASELFLNLLDSTGQGRLALIVRPAA